MIWSLIVGAIIGSIAGRITENNNRMGCITNIAAGLIGSSVGQALFGNWGPHLAKMAIFPSILGAVIVVAVVAYFLDKR